MAMPRREMFGAASGLFCTIVFALSLQHVYAMSRKGYGSTWLFTLVIAGLLFGCALLIFNLTRLWMALHNIHH